MWNYIKKHLPLAALAALFMAGEVLVDLMQPRLMSQIVDDGVLGASNNGSPDFHIIMTLGIFMVCLAVLGGLSGSLNNICVHIAGQNIGNAMRKDVFRRIMSFSLPQVDRFSTGSLITRVTNDVTQVQALLSLFVRGMIRTFMLTFGSIFFMFRLSRHFGLFMLAALPFLLACMILCLSKANPLFSKLQAQLDIINGILQEDISGIRIIKACVHESYEKLRFGKANDALISSQLHILTIFAFMNPVINMLMYLVVTLLLFAGSYDVSAGSTTPGTVMAAITYTTQMLNGVLMLVMIFQNLSRGSASWHRLREVLDSQPEITDGAPENNTTKYKGRIEFRDVSFTYPQAEGPTLSHVSFTVNPGETLAIMGATGCGKSTLVHLIPRFYDVTEGAVLLDGQNVKDFSLKELRDKISIVLQKSELYSLSVRENISWGMPNATDAEIIKAAEIAQADNFIRNMPKDYASPIAERGMSLSGGQKQRISIARAVLKPARVLIFDDSTSALDLKTEARFYEALEQEHPECTKIIVAQRIASVRRADKILILENGRIAAWGSHKELMQSCPIYQEIYYSQLGKEDGDGTGKDESKTC